MSLWMQSQDSAAPLLVSRPADGVVSLALNRPARRNAVDLETVTALRGALAGLEAAAVVLCSATPGMFCAGADLAVADSERAAVNRELYLLYGEMLATPVPILAALDGAAVGGGAHLAIACDMRVAGPGAWIRLVGPGHGLAVGAWALPSIVGRGRAIELCLSSRRLDAGEGHAIGLFERLADDPLAAAHELAASWAGLDADAVARVKAIIGSASERRDALAAEAHGNADWDGSRP